jgi:hypothetical protein
MPSPVSPVTAALALSAPLTVVPLSAGHFLSDVEVKFGFPTVVVLPLTQLIVPPLARTALLIGWELPPVWPPVQPLMVTVLVAFPVIVVQEILPPAHA